MKQQEVTNTGTAHYRGGFQYSGLSELSRILRQNETATEKALWEMLRKKRFKNLKFRRQHQISLYIVDFYCDELNWYWKLMVVSTYLRKTKKRI